MAATDSLGTAGERLKDIDRIVEQALARGELPGAVVIVIHRGKIVFRKAYGFRSLQPEKAPMTLGTVFDLASLTKPIATATSILLLCEQGKIAVHDRVPLPSFRRRGKDEITIEQLLLHTAGFIPDNPLADYLDGKAAALERLGTLLPKDPPGARFVYSDVGFMYLGQVVEHVSGKPLDHFAQESIFKPLGMNETAFNPKGDLKNRAAPTEKRGAEWQTGVVHDPRSYHLGGVAGHAGLFSTADDLAVYAQMLLGGGQYQGQRLLKAATVREMTTPRKVPTGKTNGLRAYGWDVQTAYSQIRGELFPAGTSFGHTGFTGTGMWLDPDSQTAVIFLSNRVHPDGKGNVVRLRGQVATAAAAALLPAKNH